jgi:phosphatidylglycerol:prolipoprotein diacylglycerol transferase
MGTFLLWYGICRIAVEFVRVPDAQLGYLFAFVTMGQLLSVPLVVVGCYLLYRAHRDQRPQQAHLDFAA